MKYLLFLLFSTTLYAGSYLPENNLHLSVQKNFKSNITYEQFKQIIDIAYNLYQPVAYRYNEKLVIIDKWNEEKVNAYSNRKFGSAQILLYGGLAKHPEMTVDSFVLIVCHELGHLYGGTPFMQPQIGMSAEGQADYFAAGLCASQMYRHLEMEEMDPSEYLQGICRTVTQKTPDEDNYEFVACLRKLIAGKCLGRLMGLMTDSECPEYTTPDEKEVTTTLKSYPSNQCRLDTTLSGAIKRSRPQCWFNPNEYK